MGKIRDAIKDFDKNDEVTRNAKESLEILTNLCESNAKLFKLEIEQDLRDGKTSDENLRIAISKIVNEVVEERSISQNSSVMEAIVDSFNDIFTGNAEISTGICNIIKKIIGALQGISMGTEKKVTKTLVTVEYPSIVRYDMIFWNWKIATKTLTDHIEDALVCVATKSSVDVKKLDFNTFLVVYREVLARAYKDEKDIKKAIKEAEEIYHMYVPDVEYDIDEFMRQFTLAEPLTYVTEKEELTHYADKFREYI